ncbi:hypothetical protein [Nonomuraea sp. NPDC003804]|uniref:hypothetical protein n=1 Tax=Nonomuraea sp. NPDC003804 TaxID=3154547 RepID=UPI0033A13A67
MISTLHKIGIKSSHMYAAGFASIAASLASWWLSASAEPAGIERADRWGIFVGEWAPTFFALGLALRTEEIHAMGDGQVQAKAERVPEGVGAPLG